MRRLFWMILGVAILSSTACTDFGEPMERECLADRRCAPNEAPVCGEDGVEYECRSMARCYGVSLDDSGESCDGQVVDPPQCPDVSCSDDCPNGYQVDDDGCQTCECVPDSCSFTSCEDEPGYMPCPDGTETTQVGSDDDGCPVCDCRPVQCEPVTCTLHCDNGFKTDADGCEICECREVQCEPVMCEIDCQGRGFKTDADGCEICECADGPSCANDDGNQCNSIYCGSARSTCYGPDDPIACPDVEPSHYQPPTQCVCSGDDCLERDCSSDDQCEGPEGLCVRTPTQDRSGYCVTATCQDYIDEYKRVADQNNFCQSDADCVMYRASHQCCDAYAVTDFTQGAMEALDRVVGNTTCGDEFDQNCAMEDCAPLPTDPEHAICVNGSCEWAP
jgi:hypothetical protein